MSAINPICEICSKKFNFCDELIDHYLDSSIHNKENLNTNIKNKAIREILNLQVVNNKTVKPGTISTPQNNTISQSNSSNAIQTGTTEIKGTDNNQQPSGIVRKCDVCYVIVDSSYQKYLLHVLNEHNPTAAKNYVKDPYILEAILKGGIFKKKSCDICGQEISNDVYDYIVHFKKFHKEIINNSLKKHLPDLYVLSVLLNKDCFKTSSCIVFCECGEEVEMEDYREHRLQHKQEAQAFKKFNGPIGNMNTQTQQVNKMVNPPQQNINRITTLINQENQKNSSSYSNQAQNNLSNKTISNYPQNSSFQPITSPNQPISNISSFNNKTQTKNSLCSTCGIEISDETYVEHILAHKEYTKFELGSKPSSTFVCTKCGNEFSFKDFNQHVADHMQGKIINQSSIKQPATNNQVNQKSSSTNIFSNKTNESNTNIINPIPFQNPFTQKDLPINQSSNKLDGKDICMAPNILLQCMTCGKEITTEIYKDHMESHESDKLLGIKPTSCDPLIENTPNPCKKTFPQNTPSKNSETKTEQKKIDDCKNIINPTAKENKLNKDDLISSLFNLLTITTDSNSNININFNINNNNQISNIIQTTNHHNVISSPTNSEEIKQLQDQIDSLKQKCESLEALQSNNEKEQSELKNSINQKMTERDFKMSNIEKEIKRLSELEEQMNVTTEKINELNKLKYDYNEKFLNQEIKIKLLEDQYTYKIEELEKQHAFLNGQKDNMFVDKFNEVEKQLHKLKLELSLKTKTDIDFSTPSTWVPQSDNLQLVEISKNSKEFQKLSDMFLKTMPSSKILKITRVQNLELWKNFCFAKYQLNKKGNSSTKLLFHGTRQTDPALIYEGKEEGFDMRYANSGYFGTGIYFHEKAEYSNGYKFQTNFLTSCMFIAEVLAGEYFLSPKNNSLRLPPIKDQRSKIRYDSVKADYDGIYVIYNNMRAYPSYLLEYL